MTAIITLTIFAVLVVASLVIAVKVVGHLNAPAARITRAVEPRARRRGR